MLFEQQQLPSSQYASALPHTRPGQLATRLGFHQAPFTHAAPDGLDPFSHVLV